MNKRTFLFAALVLLAVVSGNSTNYITLGDSIRIKPSKLDGYTREKVVMHIDGMADTWQMAVSYPEGLFPKLVAGVEACDGLTVSYIDRDGNAAEYTPNLNVSVQYQDISAYIPVQGYWDYNLDGYYDPYGTAKWMPGDHDLFTFNLAVMPDFRSGYITFDGTITSGYDQRGAILQNVRFFSRTFFWVGYMPGDTNGNEKYDVGDVTDIIAYALGKPVILDEFGLVATDANRDGVVNVKDVTDVIGWTLNQ